MSECFIWEEGQLVDIESFWTEGYAGNFYFFSKMALLNPCMKFEIFLAKSILLKHYENGNKNFFCNMSQGPPNPGFMQDTAC